MLSANPQPSPVTLRNITESEVLSYNWKLFFVCWCACFCARPYFQDEKNRMEKPGAKAGLSIDTLIDTIRCTSPPKVFSAYSISKSQM